MRRNVESDTRSGRIGDAALDVLYGATLVAAGLFIALFAYVGVAQGPDDLADLFVIGAGGLVAAAGLWFLKRAVRGR